MLIKMEVVIGPDMEEDGWLEDRTSMTSMSRGFS